MSVLRRSSDAGSILLHPYCRNRPLIHKRHCSSNTGPESGTCWATWLAMEVSEKMEDHLLWRGVSRAADLLIVLSKYLF